MNRIEFDEKKPNSSRVRNTNRLIGLKIYESKPLRIQKRKLKSTFIRRSGRVFRTSRINDASVRIDRDVEIQFRLKGRLFIRTGYKKSG